MNKITINNKEYNSPESYNEIPFKHFLELQKVERDTTKGNYKKCVERVSLLLNAEINEVKLYTTPAELESINSTLQFLYDTTELQDVEPIEFIAIDNDMYFVNNLGITGDYVSYEDIIMNFQTDVYAGYPFQLAMLCRKVNESLEDIQTNSDLLLKRVEIMKNLPTDIVFRVCAFFMRKEESSQRFIELSTKVQEMKEVLLTAIKKDLVENTAGMKPLSYLQVASLKLIKCSL